ncbi:MAG: hypothetical protein Ct9H300mP32_2160 [Verrucomicrobiota bacterium]|nr:MAG: hypothetical protein Ct9H300mP32_2160 [Verrucomicrobiota bacterium]
MLSSNPRPSRCCANPDHRAFAEVIRVALKDRPRRVTRSLASRLASSMSLVKCASFSAAGCRAAEVPRRRFAPHASARGHPWGDMSRRTGFRGAGNTAKVEARVLAKQPHYRPESTPMFLPKRPISLGNVTFCCVEGVAGVLDHFGLGQFTDGASAPKRGEDPWGTPSRRACRRRPVKGR